MHLHKTVNVVLVMSFPLVLLAEHAYTPASSVVALVNFSKPSIGLLYLVFSSKLINVPFLLHSTTGSGLPVTLHLSVALLPSKTYCCGSAVTTGGTTYKKHTL